MSSPNVKAKHKTGAPAIGVRTSPRTNHNPYATGSASGQPKGPVRAGHLTSGGSFAKGRGVGSYSGEEYVSPRPARALSFATPQAERAYQSSKKTHSTNISEINAIQLLPSHRSQRRNSSKGRMMMMSVFKMAQTTRTWIFSPSLTRRWRTSLEMEHREGMILTKA
jgi:hypothetical protein